MSPNRFPRHSRCYQGQHKANVPETNMKFLVMSDTIFAIFETPPVFVGRQHHFRINHVFREHFRYAGTVFLIRCCYG